MAHDALVSLNHLRYFLRNLVFSILLYDLPKKQKLKYRNNLIPVLFLKNEQHYSLNNEFHLIDLKIHLSL
jgi:hypothetical protein